MKKCFYLCLSALVLTMAGLSVGANAAAPKRPMLEQGKTWYYVYHHFTDRETAGPDGNLYEETHWMSYYRLDGDTIIKVFREGTTMDEVQKEIKLSKEAFVLGMPTPISFDVVKVPSLTVDGVECYGLVYELLNAQTLSTYVKQHPDQLDVCAKNYADLFLQLHSIEVPAGGNVPSALEIERKQVEHIRRYFPEESINMLLNIVDSIPAGNRLLHMDLQTKNAMIQEGELMLIDMGEVGYGHPLLDLAHGYSAMVSFVGDYEKVIGMPREMGERLWNKAMDYYMEGLPADVAAQRREQIAVASCIRKFSWLSLSDSFPEELINHNNGKNAKNKRKK